VSDCGCGSKLDELGRPQGRVRPFKGNLTTVLKRYRIPSCRTNYLIPAYFPSSQFQCSIPELRPDLPVPLGVLFKAEQ
jgi:hypothetical protein